jgi:hypothetical protein
VFPALLVTITHNALLLCLLLLQVTLEVRGDTYLEVALGADDATVSGIMHRLTHLDLNSKFDEELTVIWLQDLPPGLKQLQLSRYAVVLPCQPPPPQQQQQHTLPVVRKRDSSSSGGVFDCLEGLSLLDCCVLGVTGSQSQQSSSNGVSQVNEHSTTAPAVAWPVPTLHLLKLVAPGLLDLELQVPLFEGDVGFICSEWGSNLQRLHLQAAAWFAAGSEQQVAWGIAAALTAAAAESGQLQELRDLALDFTALQLPDNALQRLAAVNAAANGGACRTTGAKCGSLDALGIGLLRVCCGFRSLKHLKLAVDLQHCRVTLGSSSGYAYDTHDSWRVPYGVAAGAATQLASHNSCSIRVQVHAEAPQGPSSSSSSSSRLCSCSGAWDLLGLQHLRALDVLLRVPSLSVLGDLAPGVLGNCRGCGGGVGLEAVRLFLKHGLQQCLPTCEVHYEEVSKSF